MTKPAHELMGLLDAVVSEDGKVEINEATKRLLIKRKGKMVLRQEAADTILRAKVQGKRFNALAVSVEKIAIQALLDGATVQKGHHSMEPDTRKSVSASHKGAAEAMWPIFKKAKGLDDSLTYEQWLKDQGLKTESKKPALRLDGRLQ